jgi:hypothetical protein
MPRAREYAEAKRRGANFFRVELEPRLEKQENEAEFAEEPYGALARNPTDPTGADHYSKHELQNNCRHANERRQSREQRGKDSDKAHYKKSMKLAHESLCPRLA